MEISLYLNAHDESVGEIRSTNSSFIQSTETTVFDLIVAQRLEEAVNAAITNYRSCA